MSAVTTWSLTAASNNSAAPNGWPEGMAPAAVNDTARQMMVDVAREFQVNAVKVLSSVSGTDTITGSMSPALASYSAGMTIVFTPANTNTAAVTLNVNSLGALDIQKQDGDALAAGDLVSGVPAVLVLDSGADDWILLNPQDSISGTFTCGYTGFSANPSTTIKYSKVGRIVHLTFPSSTGTSNSTSFSMTSLPSALTPATTKKGLLYSMADNGVVLTAISAAAINTGGTIDFIKDPYSSSAVNSWTATGVKGFSGAVDLSFSID